MVVEVTAPFEPFFTEPEFNVPIILDSLASGQASPSLSKSKWFAIPSPSISFVQVNFGLALDRLEDAQLKVAFATPPKFEVPATPYNLKYLYFLPTWRLLVSTKVAGGVKVSEETGAVFKLSHNTLSTDP